MYRAKMRFLAGIFGRVFCLCICVQAVSACSSINLPFVQETDYDITGVEDKPDLQDYLQTILDDRLKSKIDEGDPVQFAEDEIVREEIIEADLLKALKAKGFYEGEVTYEDNPDKSLSGVYTVSPGPQYILSSVTYDPEKPVIKGDGVMVHEGDPLLAVSILKAQGEMYKQIQKDECYFSLSVEHGVILNEQEDSGALIYTIEKGETASFGVADFQGQESVDLSFLEKLVPWDEGECYTSEKVEKLRTKLLETGLFAQARTQLPESPQGDGSVPVTVELEERAHRSITAGASYYTDQGAGLSLGWEHRNLFGLAEKLDTSINFNEISQNVDLNFYKPYFLRDDQNLSINSSLFQEDSEAYEETAFELSSSLDRQFTDELSGQVGVALTVTEIVEDNDTETFGLVSLPLGLSYDNRDSTLNPHEGWLLKTSFEPFYDVIGESDPFTKVEGGARTYLDFGGNLDPVLAFRADAGSLIGTGRDSTPASQRFYAGGGGSVRGYGYQEVGPFENGDPVGGRSYVTGSTELRLKFNNKFGGVAFVDAGSVSEETFPDLDNLSFGTGLGVRYYTGFGPLRFDVAVPLNRRDNLDQSYQLYLSIGQAF